MEGYFSRLQKIKLGQLPKEAIPKPKKGLNRISPKKAAELKVNKGSDSEMDLWFDEMVKRCKGKCLFCNGKTTAIDTKLWKDDNEKWSQEANDRKHEQDIRIIKRASVAHLLAKSKFPSVSTHESNWIELCWSCHTSFDSGKITWDFIFDSKEGKIIKEKLIIVLPMVAQEERKHKLYSKLNSLIYGK